jgi:hypothetical protein
MRMTDRAYTDNATCLFAGTSKDGGDGTRTRDLRRDRPRESRDRRERACTEGARTRMAAAISRFAALEHEPYGRLRIERSGVYLASADARRQ